MHIPDGYIGPIMSLGSALVTVPVWSIAVKRVQKILSNRTVPLMAIFAAFSFTIMMFNVPVPGGTTAHGVGGTLAAVVLGPAAAIVTVSMALIIQALFFGDGGILAIFINCLNMAIILPVVGYGVYRLIAGRSPILSNRRVWAAGIGAYVGITASALAVGIELGLQPLLFSNAGQPLYSPYGLAQAIPAMLITHVFGASPVEAIITSLGVAYMQKRYPEYLTSLRAVFAGHGVVEGRQVGRPIWQILAMGAAALVICLLGLGLISGGGDFGHLFGADWSQVSWADVGSMLLVVLVIAIVLIPLTYFLLPKRFKGVGTAFMAAAIIAPLGLIAPGFAYGEGSTADVQAAFGYIPKGMQDLSTWFSALFSGYNINLPFFSGSNQALWQTAIGYEISGIIGMLVVGLTVFGVMYLLRRRSPTIPDEDKVPVGVGASPARKGTEV
jgi:cobalt/nickel transport system permease protein